ncbi:hypothetical protein NP493_194g08016 [Ridgeia piscesae]|uniref:Uncharacterized protein n=1 Tax=Ridgeia piscesae TaxID=27915 RepID=A0AAD9P212_RIDPI|nr:hypothetical protein NP493_194g08016 [Ridgeia piscesae]
MADSSLDDFFAKKDKSKKKSKSKFTASSTTTGGDDSRPKSDEEPKKLKKKKQKDNEENTEPTKVTTQGENEEEWIDYEQEEEIDYSSLRVQNLQISAKEEEEQERVNQEKAAEEGGEDRDGQDSTQGPWKSVRPQPAAPVPQPEPEPPKPVEEPAQKPTGKYVPPSMRRAMDGSSPASSMGGGYGTSRSRLKKTAPNLTSEDDFPTLGGGPGMPRDMDGGQFECVRMGGRQEGMADKSMKLELGNKFGALSEN